jgi:hypothetical protein
VETVKIVHPEAGEAHVPPSAVKHWESSGWTPADQNPPATHAPDKEATPSRRRANKESD